jgi:urea transport system substrate-binding protein
MINYTPFGHSDWQTIVSDIKKFGSAGKKTAVVSTINGDANVPFYKELGNQGIKAEDIPVVAFSVGEEELAGIDTKPLVGHLAAWNYFQSVDTTRQRRVHQDLAGVHQEPEARDQRPDGSVTVIGFNMWVEAVEKAGTTDPDRDRRDHRHRCRT